MAIAALGVFAITALAVHDEDFQLDADMFASTTTSIGGSTQTIDWDSLFTPNGTPPGSARGATAVDPLPDPDGAGGASFDAAGFDFDFNVNTNGSFNTSDGSTFATGSKDTLPITPGWQCNFDNNVNSKTDVMNSYATSYTSASGDEILYFALERNANTGTGNVGFWFLQDEVACESTGGTTAFSGDHVDGDILVVSEFSNGGVVSTIQVYRWQDDDGAGPDPGFLNPNSVAGGANLDCDLVTGGDSVCANVNLGTINNVPWLTSNKQDGTGHTLRASEFFEAGLNLTAEGLGGKCFNTFIGDTRSSTSLTATIFDFSLGVLGECESDTVTTPSLTSAEIPTDGTIDVTDDATVTVDGADDWAGTVQFYICGPSPGIATCDPDTADELGDPVAIDETTTMPITSANAEITEVGDYCFAATFSGDPDQGVPPSEDASDGECFTITPVTPTLTTQAGETDPVDLGDPVTDTATLSGTANQPGTGGIGDGTGADNGSINPTTPGGEADGTITFTLVKQDDCSTLATSNDPNEENPQDVDINNGGDGTYGPVSFTPDAPGDYSWKASYSGDSPNTNGATHNDDCSDTNEDVTVRQVPTAISTEQSVIPNDSATISSTVTGVNLPAGGTVTFELFGPTTGATGLENCQADDGTGELYEEVFTPTAGGAETETFDTTNTTVSVSASDTYYWKVTYDPGDSGFVGAQSNCAENTVLTFNNDAGPGDPFP